MNLFVDEQIRNLSDKRVMIPTSGGINSAAVICFLGERFPSEYKPKRLFLFYSHLTEHSPDTSRFVPNRRQSRYREHIGDARMCRKFLNAMYASDFKEKAMSDQSINLSAVPEVLRDELRGQPGVIDDLVPDEPGDSKYRRDPQNPTPNRYAADDPAPDEREGEENELRPEDLTEVEAYKQMWKDRRRCWKQRDTMAFSLSDEKSLISAKEGFYEGFNMGWRNGRQNAAPSSRLAEAELVADALLERELDQVDRARDLAELYRAKYPKGENL